MDTDDFLERVGHASEIGMSAVDIYERTRSCIKPRYTDVIGLKYYPDLEPDIWNHRDLPRWGFIGWEEVTDGNIDVLRRILSVLGNNCSSVMEIGVNRNGDRSMSRVLLDERPSGSFYLGVDIEDKSYLDDYKARTHTLCCSSEEQNVVRTYLRSHGINQLDLLVIDGWHSVDVTVNDWRYTDMLSPYGWVVLHDTNAHPGSIAVFEAVDERLWIKQRWCLDDDHGIATFKRRSYYGNQN